MEARKGSCGEKRDTRNLNGTSEIAHDCRPTRLVATLGTAVQRGSWPLLGHDRGLPATLAHKNVRGLEVSMDEAGRVDAQDALQHVRDYISLTTMTANGPVDITVDNEVPWNSYTRHQPSFGREQAKASKS